MIKRAPHVSLENAAAVQTHYKDKKPNPLVMYPIHFLAARLWKADIYFQDGAFQAISNSKTAGKQVLLAMNHQKFDDPLVVASVTHREKVFHHLRANTLIPAKEGLFNHPYYGWIVRNSGSRPVVRPKDIANVEDPVELARIDSLRHAANDFMIGMTVDWINQGGHALIYPESSRNKTILDKHGKPIERDFTKLQPLKAGIGRIACGVDRPDKLEIVCMAAIYGPNHDDNWHPTVYISHPFGIASDAQSVVDMTAVTLQNGMDQAYQIASTVGR